MKDQYLALINAFDSEHTRFWTRFNLFVGFQFVVVAGFASGFDKLKDVPEIGALFIFVGFCFAVFNVLVVKHSLQICLGVAAAIEEFEQKDDSLLLLKTYNSHTKSPLGGILKLCLAMSVLLSVFWVVFLVIFLRAV